ncbi:MAG: hypothetical protein RLZZ428_210 [Pseudomonadota bacterium]
MKRHIFPPNKHPENKILFLGWVLLGSYFIVLLFTLLLSPGQLKTLLGITITNVVFGRMAGLSLGVAAQMDTLTLIAFNFFIESIMVIILYPLFVLSWKKLDTLSYTPIQHYLEKSKQSAIKYQPLIQKYGIIGLVLFVLTPFAMTGPVVGSFVGYLIGLHHRVTLTTVLSSTLLAITLWLYLIRHFEETLVKYSDAMMVGVVITLAVLLGWYLAKKMFR